MDNKSVILEKLSFDRLYKTSIEVIWKALRVKYLNRIPGIFNPEAYVVEIGEGIDDVGGFHTNRCIRPTYDFNDAKAVFVKEPFIVFCLNRDRFYFDTKDITEDMISYGLLRFYRNASSYKTMREIKDNKRYILWEYLKDVKGYDPDSDKIVDTTDCDLRNTSYGDLVVKKACQEIRKIVENIKPDFTCSISFMDDKLLPMLIWDTEYNNVYNANFDEGDFSLNRRTLRSYYCLDEFRLDEFLDGDFNKGGLEFPDMSSPSKFRISG